MRSGVAKIFRSFFDIEPHERLKLLFLTLIYFFVIAAYTILKELKDSIFSAVVGSSYIPLAKTLTMLVLVPAILLYSYLVDKLRRYQLLGFYSILYGLVGLIFAYLLSHPTIGLTNVVASPSRLFGWLFYFFVEGNAPFVVSVFWAFANSISDPEEAKKNYGLMVSGSKLGGMFSAAIAWMLLSNTLPVSSFISSDIGKHQFLLGFAALMGLIVPVIVFLLIKNVSGRYLHGYEAAYRMEKERARSGHNETGIFSGLYMLMSYPYLLGIFCMVFFYEVINTVLSYQRVFIAQANATCVSDVSSYLFKIIFFTHLVGFIISFFGTRSLLEKLGERRCLLLIPLTTGALIFFFIFNYSSLGLLVVFVIIRAINYGFSYPVRESLYIPTVKEIKFKSKNWIDAFGAKFAKSAGSVFNMLVSYLGQSIAFGLFSLSVISLWTVAAWLLGKRFDKAIGRNEVIGSEAVAKE